MSYPFKGMASNVGGRCAIDIINNPLQSDATKVKRPDGMNIYGWALDEKNGTLPSYIMLKLTKGEQHYYAPLNRRGDRGDLVKAFGKPEFVNAGFGATLDLASLPAGEYEAFILQKGEASLLICYTGQKINLID